MKRSALSAVSVAFMLAYGMGYAAQSTVPTSADPGRIGEEMNQFLQPAPQGQGKLQVEEPNKPTATSAENVATVHVKTINIVGFGTQASDLPSSVRALLLRAVDKTYTFKQIQLLQQLLQNEFRKSGFILAQVIIPPQKVTDGVLVYRVYPGFITKVIIKGNAQSATGQLRRYANAIIDQKDITLSDLEHYLLLANRIPGLQVKSVITPDPKVVGAADLILQVTSTRFQGYVNMNNRIITYFGNARSIISQTMNRMIGADSLTVTMSGANKSLHVFKYAGMNYINQFDKWGTELGVQASDTYTRPGGDLESSELYGRSTYRAISIKQPWIVSRDDNLDTTLTYYHMKSSNLFTATDTYSYKDVISALRFGTDVNWIGWRSYNDFEADVTRGFPWAGAKQHPNLPSRQLGTSVFTKWDAQFQRTQYIFPHVSVLLQAQGQYTHYRLLSSEQMGFGGDPYGMAFDNSEITGDKAWMANVQLQYTIRNLWQPVINYVQPFVYYDYGMVWQNTYVTDTYGRESASSAGFGIRFAGVKSHFISSFVMGKPLVHGRDASKHQKSWQAFYSLTLTW